MTVRQNKKRRFYCPAELDALGIEKFGFSKFLRKKFRASAGVKTSEKTLARLRVRRWWWWWRWSRRRRMWRWV